MIPNIEKVGSRRTLLGVGPVSLNCIDSVIEISKENSELCLFIPSRRQIETEEQGRGYVNCWTTFEFADYVFSQGSRDQIILQRDHGGPWQNSFETSSNFNLDQAMLSAKASYEADIEAGFHILHLDPSRNGPNGENASLKEFSERTKELYEHCSAVARHLNRDIGFEIGTDEGLIGQASGEEYIIMIEDIYSFCNSKGISPPDFVVVPTGSKVMETRNVGPLETWVNQEGDVPESSDFKLVFDYCNSRNLKVKAHNADYLSEKALAWHFKMGIHAANVAPEFGAIETRALFKVLSERNRNDLKDRLIELVVSSGKWEKWMLPSSATTDFDKTFIAGHYLYSTDEFIAIKAEAVQDCESVGIDLDDFLKRAIKDCVLRYLHVLSGA